MSESGSDQPSLALPRLSCGSQVLMFVQRHGLKNPEWCLLNYLVLSTHNSQSEKLETFMGDSGLGITMRRSTIIILFRYLDVGHIAPLTLVRYNLTVRPPTSIAFLCALSTTLTLTSLWTKLAIRIHSSALGISLMRLTRKKGVEGGE